LTREEFIEKYPKIFWWDEMIKFNDKLIDTGRKLISDKLELSKQRSTVSAKKRMEALKRAEILEGLNLVTYMDTRKPKETKDWITDELLQAFNRTSLQTFIHVYHDSFY
jgi:hypothetical protein